MRRRGVLAQQRLRGVARGLEQIGVGAEIGESQHRHAALPRAEELAGAAHTKIVPRDFEAVAVLVDDLQPLARRGRERILVEQYARAFARPAADSAAKLVELRKAHA